MTYFSHFCHKMFDKLILLNLFRRNLWKNAILFCPIFMQVFWDTELTYHDMFTQIKIDIEKATKEKDHNHKYLKCLKDS